MLAGVARGLVDSVPALLLGGVGVLASVARALGWGRCCRRGESLGCLAPLVFLQSLLVSLFRQALHVAVHCIERPPGLSLLVIRQVTAGNNRLQCLFPL